MVTNKTRLLSAILAVMMLVTMFTGIVLPVVAEGTADLVSITDLIASGKESADKSYSVANATELEKLAEALAANNANVAAKLTADAVVYITGDCTFAADYTGAATSLSGLKASLDGDVNNTGKNSEIKGLRFPMEWLGDGEISEMRDLTFRDCHATAVNANNSTFIGGVVPKFTDVEFYDCTMTRGSYGDSGNGYAFVSVRGTGYSFSDIRMERCKMISTHNPENGGSNHGFITGRVAGCTMDGIVMIDNEMHLEHYDTSYGILAGEITAKSTFKNIFVTGTKLNFERGAKDAIVTATGLLVANLSKHTGSTMDNVIEVNNVVTVPSGVEKPMTALVGAVTSSSAASDLKATNVYSELGVLGTSTLTIAAGSSAVVSCDDALEAALALNQAGVAKKWGLRDGKLDLIKDGEKAAKKVTIEIRDPEDSSLKESYVDYTGVDGKLIEAEKYADKAVLWTEDPATAVIAGTVVTGYIVPAHTCEMNTIDNGNGTHTYVCGCEWPVANVGTVRCPEGGEGTCDQSGRVTVTGSDTEEPDANHKAVLACSVCGHKFTEYGEFDCTGELKEISSVPATSCKPEGAGSLVTGCTVCDYTHTSAVSGEELHKWDAYIDRQDLPKYHEIVCSVCGKESGDLEKHEGAFGDWQVTTPSDVDNEGVETRICACGKAETRPVAKLPGIKLEAEKAKVGNTFEVKVNLKNNPGVGGMKLELTYNADLVSLVDTANGDWDIVFDSNVPTNTSGTVTKNFHVVASEDMTGDGTVLVLTFEVKDDENLTNTNSAITVKVGNAYNYDFDPIEFEEFTHSFVIFTGLVKGDVSGDTFVNMQDAIYLLRYLSRPDGATSFEIEGITITDKIANLTTENDNVDLGDGTNTGDVNISDVIYLLKYLNFQITDAEFFGE